MATIDKRAPVTLRLPRDLVALIDELRTAQPITVSRNVWIAETLFRRIEAERQRKENLDVSK